MKNPFSRDSMVADINAWHGEYVDFTGYFDPPHQEERMRWSRIFIVWVASNVTPRVRR
jgi:hypothetical protein